MKKRFFNKDIASRFFLFVGVTCIAAIGYLCINLATMKVWGCSLPMAGGNDQPLRAERVMVCKNKQNSTCIQPAVLIHGIISNEHLSDVEQSISTLIKKGDDRPLICLSSEGGQVDAALSLFGFLTDNYRHIKTCVAPRYTTPAGEEIKLGELGPRCASGCAWLYLAGEERLAFGANKAYFGFHEAFRYTHPAPFVSCTATALDAEDKIRRKIGAYFARAKDRSFTVESVNAIAGFAFSQGALKPTFLSAESDLLLKTNYVSKTIN